MGGLEGDSREIAMEPEKSIDTGTIISNREIVKDHFLMLLKVSPSLRESLPGQFVMIRVGGREVPFLARPFSVHSFYTMNSDSIMEILYRVSGRGTEVISGLRADDEVSILGPLGRGFDVLEDRKKIVLVAGGIGIAPLSCLAEYLRLLDPDHVPEIILYFGAVSSKYLHGLERLKRICSDVRISTDDGSLGYHGPVTDLFSRETGSYGRDDSIIYACGPYEMMKKIAGMAKKLSIPCQVSIEEKMACGIGACLGCAVRARDKRFIRVCREGPVFDTAEIDWSYGEGY
jgi:dihydroorotate dehydrogenase electron transfer subunit